MPDVATMSASADASGAATMSASTDATNASDAADASTLSIDPVFLLRAYVQT